MDFATIGTQVQERSRTKTGQVETRLLDPVPELQDRLLKAGEVQSQLGLSRAKVYRLMQTNVLPTVRIGGSVRVPLGALKQWIEDNTNPGVNLSPTDFVLTKRR